MTDAGAQAAPTSPTPTGDTRPYAAGIYGTIVTASVLAAGANEKSGQIAVLVVVTVLVYWLAEQYSEILAVSMRGHRTPRSAIARGLRRGWPMVQASYLPVAVLLVTDFVLGLDTNGAVNSALATCVLVLTTLGWLGGRGRGLGLRGRVLGAALAGSFGLVMIALKLAVTH